MTKLKPARRVEIGGRMIGTINHTGKRQFTFSRFCDAVFEKPRGPFASAAIAEKRMFEEFVKSQFQRGEDYGRRSVIEATANQNRIDREELAEREETAKLAGVEALAAFSLVELAEAFAALFKSKAYKGRAYEDEKEKACEAIWTACDDTLQSVIGVASIRTMIKDAGVRDVMDDEMFDDYREQIIDDASYNTPEHPALVELKWAARAKTEGERADCIRKALYELKNGEGVNGGYVFAGM